MLKSVLFVILFSGISSLMAQKGKISGYILQKNNSIVANAIISVRSLPDSVLSGGTISNDSGYFVIDNVKYGKHILQISNMGSLPYYSNVVIDNDSLSIGQIFLSDDTTETLGAVRVSSRKPFITRSIDKTSINIEGSIYEKGENSLRLFNVIPGVRVDPIGGIQFRGAQRVTVYVDNRKILLTGNSLLQYLQSIPSESIKAFEIQSVPGASRDAQHTGTIINILLKNNYKYGLSGSISSNYQYTRYDEFTEAANINYRIGRITLTANYNWYKGKQFQSSDELQFYKSSSVYNKQRNRWTADAVFNHGKFGIDYKIDNNQTIGADYDFSIADFNSINKAWSRFSTHSPNAILDSSVFTLNDGINTWKNRMADMYYRNKFDSKGSQLDIGYSYIEYDNKTDNNIYNNYYDHAHNPTDKPDTLFINNPLSVKIHAANIDINKVFENKFSLALGSKYTYSKTDNAISYDGSTSHSFTDVSLASNQFLYNETILAFYTSIAKDWTSWSLKAGLRTEYYKYKGNSTTTNQRIGRERWDYFPSVYVQRKINDDNILTLSAARRINRPDFRQLNPFIDVSNPYFIEQGNPNLLPYFSVNTELEYLFKNKYSLTIGYQDTRKAINTVYKNIGSTIISTDENINNYNNIFLTVNAPVKVTRWWNINSSITLRNSSIEVIELPKRSVSRFSQDFWLSNKFKILNQYFLEVNGLYSRNNFIGIYGLKAQGRIDLNIKRNFLDDKLTAILNVGDPFNLYKIGWKVEEAGFNRDINRELATRFINIGLTYNFSSGKKSTSREDVNAAGSEIRQRL